ncbi:MAG TPA: hypothetical protein VHN80_04880 [Kineosporiaceae bacterium]|nr:hypothetical protein [Kineosporiaceae bacterium]
MNSSTRTSSYPAGSSHVQTHDRQSPEPASVRRHAEAQQLNESAVRRGVVAIGLAGVALIHVLDLPGKLEETPYLGVAYLGLIISALIVAEALVRRDTTLAWLAAAGIALATMAGYVVNRTLGMPGAMDDIGNWLEPLGLASLFVEGVVAVLAVTGLARRRG